MLEHFRVCGECRHAFDFAAATMTRTAGASASADAISDEVGDAKPAAVRPIRGSYPNPVRRNRRILIVFGVAAFAFMISQVGKGRAAADLPAEPSVESLWRRLLSEGTPIVENPAGPFDARPRVITALVPPGAGRFGVTVLDQAGKVVFQREEQPGERGCFLEECDIPIPSGSFRAGKFVTLFPDEVSLTLEPGRSYGVSITIAGGHASASSVFQISVKDAVLHGAAVEER